MLACQKKFNFHKVLAGRCASARKIDQIWKQYLVCRAPVGNPHRVWGSARKKNAVDLSRDLLNEFGTLENLDQATVTEMCQVKGIGPAKAAQIKAALEVGKRMASQPASIKIKLKSSRALV